MTRVAWNFAFYNAETADTHFDLLVDEDCSNLAPDRVYLVRYNLGKGIIDRPYRTILIYNDDQEKQMYRWYYSAPVVIGDDGAKGEGFYLGYKKGFSKGYINIIRTAKLGAHCKKEGRSD